jgi:hypothetical protein
VFGGFHFASLLKKLILKSCYKTDPTTVLKEKSLTSFTNVFN